MLDERHGHGARQNLRRDRLYKKLHKSADRLHVAQMTVSARVGLFEQQLGRPIYVRNKGGAVTCPPTCPRSYGESVPAMLRDRTLDRR
jgi:regulatory helix-turn-helix LysR family protein